MILRRKERLYIDIRNIISNNLNRDRSYHGDIEVVLMVLRQYLGVDPKRIVKLDTLKMFKALKERGKDE